MSLLDFQELHIEDQCAVWRDTRKGLAAVSKVSRNGQPTLTTDRHANKANIPPLDDFALAHLARKRFTPLVRCTDVSPCASEQVTGAIVTHSQRPCRWC